MAAPKKKNKRPSKKPSKQPTAATVGAFEKVASLTAGRAGHTATAFSDHGVLVVGGESGRDEGEFLAECEVWSSADNSWSPVDAVPEPRIFHTATLLMDGRVLVVGGRQGLRALQSCVLWDPDTQSWQPTEDTRYCRTHHEAVCLADGRVLVVGGRAHEDAGDGMVYLGDSNRRALEVWDPASGHWSEKLPTECDRIHHSITLLEDGDVLIVGGTDSASAEIWDHCSEKSVRIADLPFGTRERHSATRLADGRVMVSGGQREGQSVKDVALFDPTTHSWERASAMTAQRSGHASFGLADGRVLVMGGGVDSAEIWDPRTEKWDTAGYSKPARTQHASAALADGSCLLIGGRRIQRNGSAMGFTGICERWRAR